MREVMDDDPVVIIPLVSAVDLRGHRVGADGDAIILVNGGISKYSAGFVQMLHHDIAAVPGPRDVALGPAGGVPVVDPEPGVQAGTDQGELDPGDQLTGLMIVAFDLMGKHGRVVLVADEDDVLPGGLCFGEIRVRRAGDEHREVGQIRGDQGMVDGDEFAVQPVGVPPILVVVKSQIKSRLVL